MSEYRIVRDAYAGYEVQILRRILWIFPKWVQAGGTNTHKRVEDAEAYARAHAAGVVKYLGDLS